MILEMASKGRSILPTTNKRIRSQILKGIDHPRSTNESHILASVLLKFFFNECILTEYVRMAIDAMHSYMTVYSSMTHKYRTVQKVTRGPK